MRRTAEMVNATFQRDSTVDRGRLALRRCQQRKPQAEADKQEEIEAYTYLLILSCLQTILQCQKEYRSCREETIPPPESFMPCLEVIPMHVLCIVVKHPRLSSIKHLMTVHFTLSSIDIPGISIPNSRQMESTLSLPDRKHNLLSHDNKCSIVW
jgi:hypothetical protein